MKHYLYHASLLGFVVVGFGGSLVLPLGAAERTVQSASNIDEIVVTARRRDEALQETPVAVTVFGAEAIEDRAIFNISEVGRLAPNLQISAGRASSTIGFIFIRGVGQADDSPSADPGVAQYIDDVYVGRAQGALIGTTDVRSIEVLRGPQGTLYGKNAVGGAIKINSKLPGADPEYNASVAYGNFDYYSIKLAGSQPLVEDKLFLRVSGERTRDDGVMRNAFDGSRSNDQDILAGRALLRYVASDTLEFMLTADGSRNRSAAYNGFLTEVVSNEISDAINAFIGDMNDYVRTPGGDAWNGAFDVSSSPVLQHLSPKEDVWGVAFHATAGGDAFAVKSITAYRTMARERLVDADTTPFRIANFGDRLEQWQFSQEFQFSGEALDSRLTWLAGLFFFKESIDQYTTTDFVPDFAALGIDLSSTMYLGLSTKSYAAFVNVSYNFTDRFSSTLGLRYTKEKKSIDVLNRNLTTGDPILGPIGDNGSFDDLSPKLEVSYKWTDDIFTYASLSKGFKSGGFNYDPDPSGVLAPYASEKVWSGEVGFKSQWLDRRLTINLAAFYMDYKDIQLQVYEVQNGVIYQPTSNAGKARIQGIEGEFSLRPVDGLVIYGSGGITDAKYKEYQDVVFGDVSDRKFAYTPKYNTLIGTSYEFPLTDAIAGFIDASYSYRSRIYYDPVNTPSIAQSGYGLINARAALRFVDHNLELAVYGKNLTNERYLQSGVSLLDSFGFAFGVMGLPRTYGVELNWRY